MGIQERKERQKQNLRREILTAVLDLFVNEGYQCVSMRKLADKIQYSPTTIYLHFKDKAELLECVCEQMFAQLAQTFTEIVAHSRSPLEALRQSCRAYVNFGLEHPDEYTVAFMFGSGQRLAQDAVAFPMAMQAFNQLLAGVEACMSVGELEPADAGMVSQVVWAGIHGITSLLIVKPSFPWANRDQLIDLMIEAMIKSFQRQDTNGKCAVISA